MECLLTRVCSHPSLSFASHVMEDFITKLSTSFQNWWKLCMPLNSSKRNLWSSNSTASFSCKLKSDSCSFSNIWFALASVLHLLQHDNMCLAKAPRHGSKYCMSLNIYVSVPFHCIPTRSYWLSSFVFPLVFESCRSINTSFWLILYLTKQMRVRDH